MDDDSGDLQYLALGAFASAAPAGWPLFFQYLPGRSFIFWKYATGRQNAAWGSMAFGWKLG